MPFHPGKKRKALSLPSRLAAELTALGHPGAQPAQNSTHHPKSSKPAKSNQQPSKHPLDSRSKKLSSSKTRAKRLKLDESVSPKISSSKQKPKTDLERLLKKHQGPQHENNQKSTLKSREEELEDQQIAWLEAQLGLKSGQESKSKLRKEFEEDGLEDLFDGLDELDKLVENLGTKHNPNEHSEVAHEVSESECEDDDSDYGSQCSSGSGSTWVGCGNDIEGAEVLDIHKINGETPNPQNESNSKENITAKNEQAPQEPSLATASDNPKRYIPPHLRSKPVESCPSPETQSEKPHKEPVIDPRLRRQLMGILNRVSPTSIPVCLESLRDLYTSHPRAVITHGLGDLILTLISSNEPLSNALLVTYAALISAIVRGGVQVSGVEIGWTATFIADLTARICKIYQKKDDSNNDPTTDEIGKKGTNLLGFLSHLYFFQDVSCMLVYDVVRLLIEQGLSEESVGGLIVLLKASGAQLRHDDPAALKDIILLIQTHRKNLINLSPRIKFMLDTLSDLKNNKTRKEPEAIRGTTEELQQNLKKYLGGLSKKTGLDPEPIQFSLKDLQDAQKKGKWWLIGAGWKGDPLVDANKHQAQNADDTAKYSQNKVMMDLARRQGMNTDVRRSIFNAIMTGEDYVDACEKINQLGLNSIQQREIIRVLLHCLSKEKIYNPYYTMIGQKLGCESRSIQITMQFLLWDFFRELGEKDVGGHEMLKHLNISSQEENPNTTHEVVDVKRSNHFAWAYAWWIAHGALPITVLKPLPIGYLKEKTQEFLTKLTSLILLSIQSTSPALLISTSNKIIDNNSSSSKNKIDESLIVNIFKKITSNSNLTRSFLSFLQDDDLDDGFNFNLKKMLKSSSSSSSIVDHGKNNSSNNNSLVDFFGSKVDKNHLAFFLNSIHLSKSFLVEFLSHQV